jgi:hypothetical protein
VDDDGSRSEAPSAAGRRCVYEVGKNIVQLIVPHGDDYRVRVTNRRRKLAARCRHRGVTARMQPNHFDVRCAKGPEQSDPNLSGANYEYALAHSLAG